MKKLFFKLLSVISLIISLTVFFGACNVFVSDVKYSVMIEQTEGGTITADKTEVFLGEKITLTTVVNEGYELEALYLNGVQLNGYTFEMPASNVTVTATFKKLGYSITVLTAENGSLTVDKQNAAVGETVTLTAVANEGYEVNAFYLNGVELNGNTFEMPASNVEVSASFKKVVYTITVLTAENGSLTVDKQNATVGETVFVMATPAITHKLVAIKVNGEVISGNSFIMPAGNVEVCAEYEEIFAKGENVGYTDKYISTSGVDVSLDKGENPTTKINGAGEQYAYFNGVYSNRLFAEVKINAEMVLNNDEYPKFGLTLETEVGRIAFFVNSSSNLQANSVGRVYFDGNVYVWENETLVNFANMEFSGDNYVSLAIVRDKANVYFYVNGVLVAYEKDCAFLQNENTAFAVFSFNTLINLKEYLVLVDDDATTKIEQAKIDYLRFDGDTFGEVGDYKSSFGANLTFDRGENAYVSFDGDGSPQFAYIKNLRATRIYYQASFNIISIKNEDLYPKFGLFAQISDKSIFFYVDMKTDLTATKVGMVNVRNGEWDWDNARSVSVKNMAFSGEDKINLALMRDGADFVFLVNGEFALAVPDSELELSESVFGVFGFNTEMNVYETMINNSEEKITEVRKLIPRVGPWLNGTAYYLSEYVYDYDTDTISLLRADSSARTYAALYEKGEPIYSERFAVEGTVRIFNTVTSGQWASKIEFQVGVNNSHFLKICICRYQSSSQKNNSVYIEGANRKDGGTIPNTAVKSNTLPDGTDYTANYKVIYDYGTIYFVLDGEVQLIYETGWGKAGYGFGVVRYADTVWSNTVVSFGSKVESLIETYKTDYFAYKNADALTENCFIENDSKKILTSDNLLRVGGTLVNENCFKNGYNSVYIKNESAIVAEYRLFNDSGKWGIERIIGENSEVIVAPVNDSYGWMNFEVAFSKNYAVFMLNGKVYDNLEGEFENVEVSVGTKNATARLSNSYVSKFTDEQSALNYIETAPIYEYYSNYTSNINSLYNKYFIEGETKEGGFLILGASTVAGNFWETWEEDFSLTDYITGYNVGIGGTTTEDWLAAYDKLIKPFNPSRVLISVGGNDLMTNGARAIDVVNRLIKLIEKIHADFPDAIIYYPYATPGPNAWENGVWANPNYGIIRDYMKEYLESVDFAFGIDTIEYMTENGLPKEEYFRADNIHYNSLGYSVWSQLLYDSISFPENLGKWKVTSEVPVLETGMVTFGEEVILDFEGSEYAGEEGLTVNVVSDFGDVINVIREGDVFKFIMPTDNVTVTYQVAEKYTNAIWTDEGVLVKGKYTSKRIDKNNGLIVAEHFASQYIDQYLPEEIITNVYVFGYAVSTNGGTSFGEIAVNASTITLQKGDILKVYFAMMGSALSGNCVLTKYTSNAIDNNLTLGYAGNTTGTRFWGALYQNGEIYTGNEYSVDFKLTLFKNAASENLVSEIYVNSMPTSTVTNGRKIFIRWENNSTVIKRQGTDKVSSAYNSSLAKTTTNITVASTAVLSITLDVTIKVTKTGFTITISNEQDKTQVYTETYTCADTVNEWSNVSINFAFVQMGMATFSDIKIY